MWKFGTLTISPFDWLEAGYFYYRPSDLVWLGGDPGRYLDKGFNLKLIHRFKNKTNIALGFDDFAGTGYFSKEYLVVSKEIENTKYSLGIGWGKFDGENPIKNPLSIISTDLRYRPIRSSNDQNGGSLTYDKWFRGDVGIFGGLEHNFVNLKGLRFKIEYDPFNYFDFSAQNRTDAKRSLRDKDIPINIGLSYQLNKFITIDGSYIKGNQFNININFAISFNDQLYKKEKFQPELKASSNGAKVKNIFYEDLLYNLNKNKLLLQTANLNDTNLDISISTSEHRNAIRSASYVAFIANDIAKANKVNLSTINVSHINAGVELNNIKFQANYFNKENIAPIELNIRNAVLDSGDPSGYYEDEFKPSVNFPVIFSSISPSLVSHIGNPEKFYFGGVNIKHISEVQFSRNFLLSSEILLPIFSNFEDTISGASSKMVHVRTDVIQYLKEDNMHIGRLQLDYIWSPHKNVYAKISGGIFEQMFGGIGAEVLYKPFRSKFYVGAELFKVRQRDFNQLTSFKDYETSTGHINLTYIFAAGIESNISFGRYLAKDDGFTFDLSRRTRSGFKSGIYFTKTNVSADLFGEGSFDKGFYFQIPMDIFSNKYSTNYSTFKLSPLTRDGGAKLIYDKDLRGLIYNSTYYELSRQWNGFLN